MITNIYPNLSHIRFDKKFDLAIMFGRLVRPVTDIVGIMRGRITGISDELSDFFQPDTIQSIILAHLEYNGGNAKYISNHDIWLKSFRSQNQRTASKINYVPQINKKRILDSLKK